MQVVVDHDGKIFKKVGMFDGVSTKDALVFIARYAEILEQTKIVGENDSEFVGVFPVRADIEILPADPVPGLHDKVVVDSDGNIGKRRKGLGWTVSESIGVAIVNPRGVAAGKKSVIIGE